MQVSFSFFLLESDSLIYSPEMAAKVETAVAESAEYDQDQKDHFSRILRHGLAGEWPSLNDSDSFIVFDWLLEEVSERADIGALREIKSWDFWTEIQLQEEFKRHPAPFPVPSFLPNPEDPEDVHPAVWYVPATAMESIVEKAYEADSDAFDFPGTYAARLEILELMESALDDGLDMVCVLIVDLW